MMLLNLIFFSLSRAFGCSCAPLDIKTEFTKTDYVLVATVASKVARDFDAYDGLDRITDYEISLKIKKHYKGDLRKSPYVTTAADDGRCGFNLEVGQTYVFWMNKPVPDSGSSVPMVGICSRTKHISRAKEDLKWLDKRTRQDLLTSVLFN